MVKLYRITQPSYGGAAAGIWGFYQPCTACDVRRGLSKVAGHLYGSSNIVHVLSGTHGDEGGLVRTVFRQPIFFQEDEETAASNAEQDWLKTYDGCSVQVQVHDFNTPMLTQVAAAFYDEDKSIPVEDCQQLVAMSALNDKIREIVAAHAGSRNTILLGYCYSAGLHPLKR